MKSTLAINLWLVLIALIWGFGFVPQKYGMDHFGPAAFNAWRFIFGAITLLPVMVLVSRKSTVTPVFATIKLGVLLGALLFMGALLQQIALMHTSVANVAFITGLYVIVVPVIGLCLGSRYPVIVWLGGIMAIVGLYLMTGGVDSPTLKGDLVALAGAVAWAVHIILLARNAGSHPQITLAATQFFFCALFSLAFAIMFETVLVPTSMAAFSWPLLNGVVVVGIAYTLQVFVMDRAEPFSASIILSLEAVFGALAGYWVFDESFTAAASVGAGFMLIGCVLAQLPRVEKKSGVAKPTQPQPN